MALFRYVACWLILCALISTILFLFRVILCIFFVWLCILFIDFIALFLTLCQL